MSYGSKYYVFILTALFAIVVIFGIDSVVWAQDVVQCTTNKAIEEAGMSTFLISTFINFMSWAWTIPAILAGELMSNDLIYGQIVGLEHYFYQFWTLMRTIANFGLVAIIVMIIGKVISNGGKAGEVLSKYGIKILLAGVCINFSWFIVGAMVDVSTIAISGVGQLGSQFMNTTFGGDKNQVQWIDNLVMAIPDKITISKCGCLTPENVGKKNKTWDQIIENRNTATGPLIFMGAGILKLQAYTLNINCGDKEFANFGSLTLKAIVSLVLMIMFVIPLIVLVAFNFFRLIYIWGWIVFSPLIVLIQLFSDETKQLIGDDIRKATSLSTMINGLLQPIFTMGALVIGMMLIVGMYEAVNFRQTETLNQQLDGVINKEGSSTMTFGTDGDLGSITLIDNIIADPTGTIGGGFGYILLSLATCFVLRMLVKMSFTMSKGGVGAAMGFDADKLMNRMRDEYITKRVTIPKEIGGPLGGVSLKEAASFIDPTDKNNKVMKKIEDIGKGLKDAGEKDAFSRMKKSGLGKMIGLNNEADFDTNTFKFTSVKSDADLSQWNLDTTNLFDSAKKLVNDESNSYKEFPLKTGTVAFDVVSKWYDSIAGILDKTFDDEDYKKNEKGKKFGEVYGISSYAAGLFNYMKSGKKITLSDGKIKEYKDIKRARFSESSLK